MLEGKAPSLRDIVIFGSPCMVYRDNNKAFGARATQAFILGRSEEVKGYVVYLIKDKKVTTTQHVKNIETLSRAQNASLLMKSGVHDGTTTDTSKEVQKSDSGRGSSAAQTLVEKEAAKQSTSRVKTRTKDKRESSWKVRDRDQVNNVSLVDPSSYAAAMKTDKAKEWQVAVDNELDALQQNATWVAVPKPAHAKILHSKSVFKTKVDADGKIERHKARLVVCGNEQVYGESYFQTFAPVMDMTTARYILALSVFWKVPARHGDIPNAYVRAEREEGIDIYMHMPHGMKPTTEELNSGGAGAVLKLLRSLYGLKQARRLWNALLHTELLKLGFSQCKDLIKPVYMPTANMKANLLTKS